MCIIKIIVIIIYYTFSNFFRTRRAKRSISTLRRAAYDFTAVDEGELSFTRDSFIKELGEV